MPNAPGALRALAVHDDGQGAGPELWAGGVFGHSSTGDAHLTRYGGCAAPVGTAFCFGDGSGSACPCGNVGAPGTGCANSAGSGATLTGQGTAGVGADDLGLAAHGLIPGQPALLYVGNNAVQGGAGLPFGDGLRCAGGGVRRLAVRTPDAAGSASWGPGLAADGGWAQGDTRRFQVWYRDPLGSPCGANFNYTNAFEVTFGP